jgi:hypothetical protein
MSKRSKQLKLVIKDGRITAIYNDALTALREMGVAETKRASHVEPDGNTWYADLSPVGGPLLTGFKTRKEALEAEVAYLREYVVV